MLGFNAWVQLLAVVLLSTIAQIALKATVNANKPFGEGQGKFLQKLLQSPLMWTWFLCYVGSMLLWLWTLRAVPLSQAFPILGLQFALIPLASSHFFSEKLAWEQWLGVSIIVAGVILVGRQ